MKLKDLALLARASSEAAAEEAQSPVVPFMTIVIALIVIVSIFALMVAIWLSISYTKYNHQKNTAGKTGQAIARQVLDGHDLKKIKVAASGSILLGNSYSHLFRKVRLRRRACKADSVAALAVGVQTPCLAILDDQDDADMKARRQVTPLICLGPWGMIPLILVGWALDLALSANGWCLMGFTILAILLHLFSLFLAVKTLKTEKKAQTMALSLMAEDDLATPEEIDQCKKLYRLYTIEHINNMFLALLELVYRILQIFTYARDGADVSPTDPAPTDE